MTFQCNAAVLVHVTKQYGNTTALRDVNLTIRVGEVCALLGRNGAGKTTFVRTLVGLTTPDAGTIKVFQENPARLSVRRKVGVQLQIAQMPDTLRVREYIKLYSSYYAAPMPVDEVVKASGLRGLEGRLFRHLSGGEQQRLRFGIAICGNPEFVILDEPTVGLDVETRNGLWDQIRSLARKGKTILLTTHYLQEADAIANRIIIIGAGQIIADGTPKELKANVSNKRIRCTSTLPLDVVLSMRNVRNARKEGDRFEIQTDDTDELIRQLVNSDGRLGNIEIASTALEDSFLALTRQNELGQG